MSEMTPERLRTAIKQGWHVDMLYEAASAWEADLVDAAAVRHERDILYESEVKLEAAQARIEALEREVAAWKLAATYDDWSGTTVLAAKEKP